MAKRREGTAVSERAGRYAARLRAEGHSGAVARKYAERRFGRGAFAR